MTAQSIARRIGHTFSDPLLLRTALTHRSFGTPNNERLEFLGDGVLDCVIAAVLFHRYPDLPEGDLSRLRSNLVNQNVLHQLSLDLDIGSALRLGEGELKSGGALRPSILADALEAMFGAIYLDAGFDAAKIVIEALYAPLVSSPGSFRKTRKHASRSGCKGARRVCPAISYWKPLEQPTNSVSKSPVKSNPPLCGPPAMAQAGELPNRWRPRRP